MEETKSPMVDVTDLDFGDDEAWQASAVTESVKAIVADIERSAEAISGWSSFLDG